MLKGTMKTFLPVYPTAHHTTTQSKEPKMTPKQRKIHIESLKKTILDHGFKLDSFGNYKAVSSNCQYRIKFMKINLRIERKASDRWLNCQSLPIVQVTLDQLLDWLAKHPVL